MLIISNLWFLLSNWLKNLFFNSLISQWWLFSIHNYYNGGGKIWFSKFIIPTSGWLVVFLKKGFSFPLGTSCFKCIIIMDAKISFLFSMLKLISAIIHFTALIIPHLASGRSFKVVPASLWHVFISSPAPDQLLSKKVWVLLVRNSNLVSKICVLGMLITFRISLLPGFCSRQN